MFDDVYIILDDDLPEKTILVPESLLRTSRTSRPDLAVGVSPDEAIHCSWDVYDVLGALTDARLNFRRFISPGQHTRIGIVQRASEIQISPPSPDGLSSGQRRANAEYVILASRFSRWNFDSGGFRRR